MFQLAITALQTNAMEAAFYFLRYTHRVPYHAMADLAGQTQDGDRLLTAVRHLRRMRDTHKDELVQVITRMLLCDDCRSFSHLLSDDIRGVINDLLDRPHPIFVDLLDPRSWERVGAKAHGEGRCVTSTDRISGYRHWDEILRAWRAVPQTGFL